MRAYVGITDSDWYQFLSTRPELDEVNFWRLRSTLNFGAIDPGELFLFKLHGPDNFIVGGGVFAHYSPPLPTSVVWQAFGEKNGAPSKVEMLRRVAKYRREARARNPDHAGIVGPWAGKAISAGKQTMRSQHRVAARTLDVRLRCYPSRGSLRQLAARLGAAGMKKRRETRTL